MHFLVIREQCQELLATVAHFAINGQLSHAFQYCDTSAIAPAIVHHFGAKIALRRGAKRACVRTHT
jgi:hypothetical protein